jgi:adenylosuccinate lyase
VYSQKVLLKLTEKGYTRENAYKIVQKHALNALNGGDFKQELLKDSDVTSKLSEKEINDCFEMNDYLKNIDEVFNRFI